MKAIVLSGPPASGKTTVARILSERLGVPAIGGTDILKEMAADRGYKVSGEDWWDTEEAMKFVRERATNPDFDKETDKRLLQKIDKGDVVITSYAAPWFSRKSFNVWLDGSPENRAKRMAERDSKPLSACTKILHEREQENQKLYMKLYGIDFGKDKSVFDLVVDTNGMPAKKVADTILKAYKKIDAKK